jgi:hypothetical protein
MSSARYRGATLNKLLLTSPLCQLVFSSHVHIRNNIKRNALVAQDIKGDDTQTVVISKDLRHYAALPVYYCYSTTTYTALL